MAELSDLVDRSIRRIENLGLSIDNATVVLVAFSWNERYILDNWDNLDSGLVERSGIVLNFLPMEEEVQCSFCGNTKTCRTRGCEHFFCNSCLKVYAEGRIQAGEVNVKCPLVNCDRMVTPSNLCDVVSDEYREAFRQGILKHYACAQAARSVNRVSGFQVLFSQLKVLFSQLKVLFGQLKVLFGQLKGFVWRHRVGITATLVCAFMICYLFCGGGTIRCVGEFTVLKVAAHNAFWGSTLKIGFLFFLYKLLLTNSLITSMALSSALTAFIIFMGIAASIRRFCLAVRRN